jgi:hypothetical protein
MNCSFVEILLHFYESLLLFVWWFSCSFAHSLMLNTMRCLSKFSSISYFYWARARYRERFYGSFFLSFLLSFSELLSVTLLIHWIATLCSNQTLVVLAELAVAFYTLFLLSCSISITCIQFQFNLLQFLLLKFINKCNVKWTRIAIELKFHIERNFSSLPAKTEELEKGTCKQTKSVKISKTAQKHIHE